MALNGGIFNLLPFSRTAATTQSKKRKPSFAVYLNASVGFSVARHRAFIISDVFYADVVIYGQKAKKAALAESLNANINLLLNHYRDVSIIETLESEVTLNKEYARIFSVDEDLKSGAYLNKEYLRAAEMALYLNVATSLGLNLYRGEIMQSEFLNAFVDVISTETTAATITITMPPGSRLVIDSENYNVTLNKVNVIDKYSGGWVTLSRELLELNIETGTGSGLSGTISYVELYI